VGYSTNFSGSWKIEPKLKPEHRAYLDQFSTSRRMMRDPKVTERSPDPLRLAVGLPVGVDGGYFVGPEGDNGQGSMWNFDRTPEDRGGIIDSNGPPTGQPGLWCKWEPNGDGTAIVWSGAEKFYDYVEWAQYLLDHFLTPWGYKLSGRVNWQGEDGSDTGYMVIYNGKVFVNEEPVLERLADAL
jgi:hypothetical protein